MRAYARSRIESLLLVLHKEGRKGMRKAIVSVESRAARETGNTLCARISDNFFNTTSDLRAPSAIKPFRSRLFLDILS